VIEILSAGPLSTVQDLGRPGWGALGVGASGAADRGSFRLANRLVGNPESAAALELTFGGLRARITTPAVVALTGAPARLTVAGRDAAPYGPIDVPAGRELEVDRPSSGLRSYLAVRGGVAVRQVLGSRSTDLLGGLGPPIVRAGDRLPIGADTVTLPNVDLAPPPVFQTEVELRLLPGPRDDWFDPAALVTLETAAYTVTPESNRIGVRLSGPSLNRAVTSELPPEGMVTGALQVPPNGQPVLFLADHPATGGYPVIGVVLAEDIDHAAQVRPGDTVRFRLINRPGWSFHGWRE
jgi:biotin-dependent carboxylase-like uncharacterized protein